MEWKDNIERNPEILLSEKRVRAFFSDVYRNDRLCVNLMMFAYDIGIITEMRESYPLDHFTVNRLTKKMVNEFGVSDEKASWAINNWIKVISSEVLNNLITSEKKLLIENEDEKRRKHEEESRLLMEEAKRRLELEKEEIERDSTPPDRNLKTKADYDDYYVNPILKESDEYIYIPCGFGQSDNGFFIYGIKKAKVCRHPNSNIYALIYNYLTRSSTITEETVPRYIQDLDTLYELDYRTIYRLSIVLLQLIRHNYTENQVIELNYTGDLESLKYAVRVINNYAALFCRLIGINSIQLRVKAAKTGIPISLENKSEGIYVIDNLSVISNAREIWYGRRINYHLTKENLPDLEYILKEISYFDAFKEGQFSALCDMLACKKHAVCIMPTGSGKSLIFYIASLLQPLPMFIVSPTDILIEDQIRNLKKFHHMDNVAHLQLTSENSFVGWEIYNSLNYLTPTTFQNRNLLEKFRYLNAGTKYFGVREERIAPGALVSYVILDEIHCLSNWGHDFRPEYLMLSKYLNKYFDHINFWGFTATANYTVVEDVQKQLNIPQDNFFSPITFERYNVSYDFRMLHTEEEMLREIASITSTLISRNERTIVFTKSDDISEKVANAIGWEADIFSNNNPSTYYHFASGESKILVATNELGVGINLPDIRNVIHFGLPLSKNEYVQEIGRAGRANENVKSYVLYLDTTLDNVPEGLLKRDTPIHRLSSMIDGYENDYAQVYQKLSNGAVSNEELYKQLIHTYQDFVQRGKAFYVDTYSYETIDKIKQQLYMLYLSGYINDWYSFSQSKDGSGLKIYIDICSVGNESYKKNPNKMINRMKEHMHSYFVYMGNSRESIAAVDRAKSPEEIIRIYVKWYYEKYLYHHNEQFLDFFDFIMANKSCDKDKITEDLSEYFVLPFAKLKNDEALYNELSIKEIITRTTRGIGKNTLINLERINGNRYSYKLDLALFCGQLRMNNVFDESRLSRILPKLSKEEITQLSNSLCMLYPSCNTAAKINLVNYMERNAALLKTTYINFLKMSYSSGQKDDIYFGIMAYSLNKYFDITRR